MHQTMYHVKLVFGIALTLALLGWSLYRLAVWFKVIKGGKQTKAAKRPTNGNQIGLVGKPVSTKGQKKGANNHSRRMFYTSRREHD
ncbi:hypothetical protein [Larkinella humicola]|uniref:Uncharacterized protein n=1 Tax=Larkinella humicola TaxID=2607654 RepID=A0A5N1J4V0_9BACT|nr:hypothetical protein [Larkinella humicola]KAA9341095.1 hypothetical protein F0P93_30085 [Larkinella humicola]